MKHRRLTRLDVFKLKQVPLYKCALDLLIGPRNKQLVIVIGLQWSHVTVNIISFIVTEIIKGDRIRI